MAMNHKRVSIRRYGPKDQTCEVNSGWRATKDATCQEFERE